jgi:glycosyltransferase involved in cell wall biosynthesis
MRLREILDRRQGSSNAFMSAQGMISPLPSEAFWPPTVSTSARTLLYVEPEADGHHLALYAACIWEKLVEEGWRIVWLTSHHALRSEIAGKLISHFGNKLEVCSYDIASVPKSGGKPWAWLRYQLQHRRMLNSVLPELTRNGTIDCIFMPWLNYCDRVCGLLGLPPVDVPICALHMHISVHEPLAEDVSWLSRISHAITKRTMARLYGQPKLKTVAAILESFVEYAQATHMTGWQKLTYVPDVGSLESMLPREESRKYYGIGPNETVVLVFGAISKRKGVGVLLQAVTAMGEEYPLVVVLAGRQDAEVKAQVADFERCIRGKAARLVVQDSFVSSADERRLFSVADIVWVGYPGFLGSSGVLTQAGCAGLPVVTGVPGEIGRAVLRSQCGLTCNLANAEEVAAALATLAKDRSLGARLGANGKERSRQHSPAIFATNIHKLIQAAMEPVRIP